MSHSIQYKVTKLWRNPEPVNGFDAVVVNVFFDIIATDTDSGATGVYSGVANLPEPEPSASGFIAFADLTEAQLITWIKSHYGSAATEVWEQQAVTAMQSAAATQPALPWA